VGGDSLRIEAELGSGARALLTTPAAGKFYRSSGATAHQTNRLGVADGAALEWLPQESIVFQGARVRTLTRVELAGSGRFMGWEILCLGRPAAAETFTQGICRQGFEIFRDGLPLYLDNSHYEGGSRLLSEAWGLHGFPVVGCLLCTNAGTGVVQALRTELGALGNDELLSFTRLNDILVGRYRGLSAGRARQLFSHAWTLLRPAVMGKPAIAPRIWNT
jgi:urease accessory protein